MSGGWLWGEDPTTGPPPLLQTETMRSRLPVTVLAALCLVIGCSSSDEASEPDTTTTTTADVEPTTLASTTSTTTTPQTTSTSPPAPLSELPRGGTRLFPDFRVVAHYGNAESNAMGILGETPPSEAAARLEAVASEWAEDGRPVLPAFELIVTVAQPHPGPDGNYSLATPDDLVREWHRAAREADMLLILDLQPGTGSFVEAAQRYEDLLREPDVGLALDPEWRMPPGQIPGRTIGTVDASEVNEVSEWLAAIVAEERLPEKLFVIHLFTDSMVADRDAVVDRDGLATVFHVDGFGGREIKLQKYEQLKGPFAKGFKLFHDEDTDLFEPADVLAFDDPPDLITYQ